MVAETPWKVTATSLPLKFDPLTMAKDRGENAPRSALAAFTRLCKTTLGAAGVTTGAGGVGGVTAGAGAAVTVTEMGSDCLPDCGPASTVRRAVYVPRAQFCRNTFPTIAPPFTP